MGRIAQNQREQDSAVRISEHINCHNVNWHATDREELAPCSHEAADSGMTEPISKMQF